MTGKASPGQSIYDSPLGSSRVINRVLEAGDDYAQRRRLSNGAPQAGMPLPTDVVKVKNLTGGDRSRGNVVELGSYLLSSFTRGKLWLEGNTPSVQGVPNVAVLAFPTPSSEILDAHAAGICLATVNVQHASDRFCYVKAGEYRFTGGAVGHHRILDIPSATGERLCVVSLGTGVLTCLGRAAALIDEQDSGNVTVIAGTPGSWSNTGQSLIGCYNPGPPIYETQLVTAGFLHGQLYVFPAECDP